MSIDKNKHATLTAGINQLRQQLRDMETQLAALEAELKSQFEEVEQPAAKHEHVASSFDLLNMPDQEGEVFSLVNRQGRAKVAEIAAAMNQSNAHVEAILVSLTTRGLLNETHQNNAIYYELATLQRQKRELPADLWDMLENRIS
jgi:Mn-dependent DtxR family transcriptional regulator